MELRPGKQLDSIARSTARINLWTGSVRAGKTVGSSLRWLEFVKAGPAGNLLMIGRTERTLQRNVLDPLGVLLGDQVIDQKIGAGYLDIQGRRIYVAGANDIKAITKIQGLTLAGAYGDEMGTWADGIFPMILTRMSIDRAKFFGTMNPEGPFHPIKADYIDKAEELGVRVFPFTLDDNPFLSEEFKAAVTAEMKAAGPMFYQRYILGLWVAAEGAIYGLEPDGPYVVDQVPEGVSIIDGLVCIDYGTSNPTVFLYLGLGDDDHIYVLSEYRHDPDEDYQRKTDQEFAADFREWRLQFPYWDGIPVVVDPSAASFITQLHRDSIRGVRKANNAVLDGIRLTASLLGADRIRIVGPEAPGLVREMSNYVWDPKAAEKGEDKPLKKDDHGPDALRYGLMKLRLWWKDWITFDPESVDDDE